MESIKETKLGSVDIQNWDYDFEPIYGNMTKRNGIKPGVGFLEETFTYDDLNRLIGSKTYTNVYDPEGKGNIASKSDVGAYWYSASRVHKLDSINNLSESLPELPEQEIEYTKFNKISSLTHTSPDLSKQLIFTYGPDEQRVKTEYKEDDVTIKTRYYALGTYEREVAADGTERGLYYISTPSGLTSILEKTGSQTNYYYIHTDILGSFDVITNSSGGVVERMSFDPWGRRRNPVDWTYDTIPSTFLFDRGFTGHEHLDQFGLINMNGRVYDPLIAMFLSPDNYVQNPDFTQNFNRYAYCLNNPLVYTDPDGEFFIPMLIGSVISVITNGISNTVHNQPFFQGAGMAALTGGIASFGIGQATMGMHGLDKIVNQTFGHGLLGGSMSGMSGGSFGSGFISGAFGSLAATGSGALLSNVNNSALYSVGMVGSGAIVGGIGSEIGGGDFWDGFRNGAISSVLNHWAHDPGPKFSGRLGDWLNKLNHLGFRKWTDPESGFSYYINDAGEIMGVYPITGVAPTPGIKGSSVRSAYQKSIYLRELAESGKLPKWMNQWLKNGKVPPGYQVDHKLPLSVGGKDIPSNMRLNQTLNHWMHHIFYHPWRP